MEDTFNNQENSPETQEKNIQEIAQLKEKFARLSSDFENYKRRTEKEKITWMHSAQAAVFTQLLSIVDDFERAIQASKSAPDIQSAISGFDLIYKSLLKLLDTFGVKEIADQKEFDPEKHEALMHVDTQDHQSGAVVQTLQKGFIFKDQVLRPAKVSVAK